MAYDLTLVLTRDPGDIFSSMMAIRREYHFQSPYDERYWNGGVHELLTETGMRDTHENDPGSHFALAFTPDNQLQAYARFSVGVDFERSTYGQIVSANPVKLACVHVLIARNAFRGLNLTWQYQGQEYHGKVGRIMYEALTNFSTQVGAGIILANVCIYPIPNQPSLCLHRKLGFVPLGGVKGIEVWDDVHGDRAGVSFVRLVKQLGNSGELQRLPTQQLLLKSNDVSR